MLKREIEEAQRLSLRGVPPSPVPVSAILT